jgi:hypothetical protein
MVVPSTQPHQLCWLQPNNNALPSAQLREDILNFLRINEVWDSKQHNKFGERAVTRRWQERKKWWRQKQAKSGNNLQFNNIPSQQRSTRQ